MNTLETLYKSIKGLQDLGLPLNEETLKAADELEEQLIKSEVLPTISNSTKVEDLKRFSDHFNLGLKIKEIKPASNE